MHQFATVETDLQEHSPRIEPKVRILRTISEMEEIRKFWIAGGGHRDSDLDFFLSLFAGESNFIAPHVAVVYKGSSPDALLVGRIERTQLPFRIGYLQLFQPTVRVLNIQYGGLWGNDSADNCRLLVDSVLNSLSRNEADLVLFQPIRRGSALDLAVHAKRRILTQEHFRVLSSHRSLVLPRSVSEFHRIKPRVRQDRNRYSNRLKADYGGATRIDSFNRADEIDRLFDDVERIARSTYQRQLGVGFDKTPQIERLLRFCAEQGWLRAYVLYVADQPCAFIIGTLYQRKLYLDFVGFDPKYSRYSPGTFLLIKKLEDFCTEGISAVDFGIGDSWYKEYFSTESWMEGPVHIFRSSLKGISLNLSRTVTVGTDLLLKRCLERSGLLAKVKKLWKGHVVKNSTPETPDDPPRSATSNQ